MAIHVSRITPVKKFIQRLSVPAKYAASTTSDVPKGCLAVYVGEQEKRRFVVPLSILNQPLFQELLGQVEEKFGFDHQMGGLTIPCREDLFIHLTSQLRGL